MPPYTVEDYNDFEKIWATTLAGAALDKKVEFIVGGGIRPVFDLKRNIKKGLSEQEIKKRLSSYDDLLQILIDTDERVEFNQRLKVSILLSKVFGRACMLFDYTNGSTIPNVLKIIYPRYLGRVVLDEVTWQPIQLMVGEEYINMDEMIYLVNLPYTPVTNSEWYGFSELQRVVGAAKALQRFIEYDAPEIAESMWAGYGLFIVNTANKSSEEADAMLNALVNNIKAGAFNAIAARKEDIEFRTLDLEPKVQELVQLIDAYERLIIGEEYRQYYLQEGCTRVPVPKLELRIPIANKYEASERVPPMVEPNILNTRFTTVEFNLWKNVVALAVEDESRLRLAVDPFASQIKTVASALGRAVAKQIVEELSKFNTIAKDSWSSLGASDNFSAYNPLDHIAMEYSGIADNGYEADTIIMHPRTWAAYQSNTFIKGYTILTQERLGMGVFPLPGWPGITAVVDSLFMQGQAALYDRKTFLLGEGPTVIEQGRDIEKGMDKYIIRQWVQPLLTTKNSGIIMTNLL